MTQSKTANVIGLGLIGGSVAAGLISKGWVVYGSDIDASITAQARSQGIISEIGLLSDAIVTFVATPVKAIHGAVTEALSKTTGLVTDVGSVKSNLVGAVTDDRFIGGHPMAGSELDGLDGVDQSLFEGAVWILTPRSGTPDTRFRALAAIVKELGAEVIALPADRHDELVATVSHVPHLTAATLMNVAHLQSTEHAALLRLAAGGFRDMTRIASGSPSIWLDICETNKTAIVQTLDELIVGLTQMRTVVSNSDREELLRLLTSARKARSNLPVRVPTSEDLVELRVPIPDRAGAAAEIFTLAAELGVNIFNFEIVHSVEGQSGILVFVVERGASDLLRGGLVARGFRPTVAQL